MQLENLEKIFSFKWQKLYCYDINDKVLTIIKNYLEYTA